MKCQIIRNATYTRGSINNIINENNRDGKERTHHKNENIEKRRSHLNMSYGITGTGYQTWKNRLEKADVEVPKHKTGNLGQIMVTASPNFFKENGWSIENTEEWETGYDCPEVIRQYFNDAVKFFKDYLGKENVLSIHLHFDETSPNLHINYIPIHSGLKRKNVWARDENGKLLKNEKGEKIRARDENGNVIYKYEETGKSVNASAFWEARGGRQSYRKMQDAFYEAVGKKYGLDRGELGSKRKHKNHHEFNTKIEEQAKTIEAEQKVIGQLKEREQAYRHSIEETQSKQDPLVDISIKQAETEIQRDVYLTQVKELLKATSELVPDKVDEIKKKANKAINEKYVEIGARENQ